MVVGRNNKVVGEFSYIKMTELCLIGPQKMAKLLETNRNCAFFLLS